MDWWGKKHDTRRQNLTARRQSFRYRLSDTCRFVFQMCFRLFQIVSDCFRLFLSEISDFLPSFRFLTKFQNFDQISEFPPNFGISTKFCNFYQISEFQPNSGFTPNFGISTKFRDFHQISEFLPNFEILHQLLEFPPNFRFSTNFQKSNQI